MSAAARVVRAVDEGLDPDGGDWVAVCDEHGTLLNCRTRDLARRTDTIEFCDGCRDDADRATNPDLAKCMSCGDTFLPDQGRRCPQCYPHDGWSDAERALYPQVIRFHVQRLIQCPLSRAVLDVDTCVVAYDTDGDPIGVYSPEVGDAILDPTHGHGVRKSLAEKGVTVGRNPSL